MYVKQGCLPERWLASARRSLIMTQDIASRINDAYPSFSKCQRMIANAIMASPDKVAYMTASKLGKMVGVSESTVVRFAIELGFEGYPEFQRAVQEHVRVSLTPNQRIEVSNLRIGDKNVLDEVMNADVDKIKYTLEHLDREAFSASVSEMLRARTIYVFGVRSSSFLASFLHFNLSLILDNVRLVTPTSSSEVFEQILDIDERDVMIAISFPRYSKRIINAVEYARSKKADVVALTDSKISPIASYADQLLIAQSDMASFVDSLVAPLSIINAMIVAVSRKKQDELTERLRTLEEVWDRYDVYDKKNG